MYITREELDINILLGAGQFDGRQWEGGGLVGAFRIYLIHA